jgi:integrase
MLKLIKPGERKGNRYYIIRGRFQGVDIEKTTETTDETVALRIRNEIERRILNSDIPGRGAQITFHRACDLYESTRQLHENDSAALKRIKTVIADKPLEQMTQADLDFAAQTLHPDSSNEWRNRSVYTPCIAVMTYAAQNEWTHYRKWTRPKQKKPETRAASDHAARVLLRASKGMEKFLILWLFKHGTRISDTLSVRREKINLDAGTYDLWISKSKAWRTMPLDALVARILRPMLRVQPTGPLFPWRTRWQVYDWLTPLRERLGVTFTPHMARHWLGKQLDAAGAGQQAIANALGQESVRSTARYVSSDIETVRAFQERAARRLGKKSGKPR